MAQCLSVCPFLPYALRPSGDGSKTVNPLRCKCLICNAVNDGDNGAFNAKKGSPHSITERRVPELIPVLGSQPAGDVSHKPGDRLPLLSARPAVTSATLKRVATNFAAW